VNRTEAYIFNRIPAVDGLRGCAILLVVFFHYFANEFKEIPVLGFVVQRGWTGVDLFFVLSGFLVGSILLENHRSPHYFKVFYLRRFLRIIPVFYLITLGTVLLLHLTVKNFYGERYPTWVHLLFLTDLWLGFSGQVEWVGQAVNWSLAIEERFYLVAPLFLLFWAKRFDYVENKIVANRKFFLCITLLSLVVVVMEATRFFAKLNPSEGFRYYAATYSFEGLFFGVVLALLYKSTLFEKIQAHRKALAGVFLATFFLVLFTPLPKTETTLQTFFAANFNLILCLFYSSALLWILVFPNSFLGKSLSVKPLRYWGYLSYPIYLSHLIISFFLVNGFKKFLGDVPFGSMIFTKVIALAVTFSFSYLLWKYLEIPLISLGKKFKYASDKKPAEKYFYTAA